MSIGISMLLWSHLLLLLLHMETYNKRMMKVQTVQDPGLWFLFYQFVCGFQVQETTGISFRFRNLLLLIHNDSYCILIKYPLRKRAYYYPSPPPPLTPTFQFIRHENRFHQYNENINWKCLRASFRPVLYTVSNG